VVRADSLLRRRETEGLDAVGDARHSDLDGKGERRGSLPGNFPKCSVCCWPAAVVCTKRGNVVDRIGRELERSVFTVASAWKLWRLWHWRPGLLPFTDKTPSVVPSSFCVD